MRRQLKIEKNKMKKTYLAVFIIPTMLAAGPANAAFVESTDGMFSGKLDFTGTVVDMAPNWKWQIQEASVAKASDWVLIKTNSKVNGNNTEWDLASKGPIDFLQGFMQSTVKIGRSGLTPVVAIAGVQVDSSTSHLFSVPVTATVGDSPTADGVMTGTYTQVYAGISALFVNQIINIAADVSNQALAITAKGLLDEHKAALEAKYPGMTVSSGGSSSNTSVLSLLTTTDLAQQDRAVSLATSLSDFKISFPTGSIPDSWNASIPVEITLQ